MSTRVDSIVIRYNDLDLQQVATSQAGQQSISGGFHSVRTITVRCGGKRLWYMDLLNAARSAATGGPSRLHVGGLPSLGGCHLASFLRQRDLDAELENFFNRQR